MLKKRETERLLDKNVVFNDVKNICHVFLFFVLRASYPSIIWVEPAFPKKKKKLNSYSI